MMKKILPPAFTGKNKHHFAELDSTNNYSLDLISKTNPPDGTCISTDYQSAGRGQIGRYWHSEVGSNMLISYIFYPGFLHVTDQFYLNIISSLAVRDVVGGFCGDVSIKWPNDIYIRDKKVAGILVQNILRLDKIKATVIGIGLNINQTVFPSDIPNPISVALETNASHDLADIQYLLDAHLEQYYVELQAGYLTGLKSKYQQQLYRKSIESEFTTASNEKISATILGVDDHGKLLLKTDSGAVLSFGFREISYVI